MDTPNNENPIDRPIADICLSMMRLVVERKVKGQFARDLEKLCAAATIGSEGLEKAIKARLPTEFGGDDGKQT